MPFLAIVFAGICTAAWDDIEDNPGFTGVFPFYLFATSLIFFWMAPTVSSNIFVLVFFVIQMSFFFIEQKILLDTFLSTPYEKRLERFQKDGAVLR